jgi:hypothetical protein
MQSEEAQGEDTDGGSEQCPKVESEAEQSVDAGALE